MRFERSPRREPTPPGRDEPQPFEVPEWFWPPEHVIGAGVALDPVVIAGERVAIALSAVRAFPAGLLVDVTLVARDQRPGKDWHGSLLPRRPPAAPLEANALGWGFDLGAIGQAGNDAHVGRPTLVDEEVDSSVPPDHPVLTPRQGSGGVGGAMVTCWLWPLPNEVFQFVVEWPAEGIRLTHRSIDVALVSDAAHRAVTIW